MGVQNWMNNKGSGKVARTALGGKSGSAPAAGKGFVKSTPIANGKGGSVKGAVATSTPSTSAGKGAGSGSSWNSGGSQGSWGGNSGGGGATDALALVALASMLQGAGGGGSWGYEKKFRVDKSGGELGEFIGTIKSFGFSKNYGFIECPDIAAKGFGDIFLHGDHKKGYKPGQTVKFSCVVNKEGKAVALDLKSGLK
eukprot:TRINITY_DN10498_c0_g1_i2.p2 TRINITY_DN10498_c0_g1~~TRINITY_DN10498_c0_g1_i2.p2  ORF type:complete len:197 (-),score=61.29 TRINITY_DN10498_c0_g1_i2:139-729(-)